jgi:pimeloyl-ACP methyl ester carboxylesterase
MKPPPGDLAPLAFVVEGAGAPVILLHGLSASHYDWQSLTPALSSAGYQSFAPDLFGHGDSPKPDDPSRYTTDHTLSTLSGWLDDLKLQEPAVLIGHSLGGYLSLCLALIRPRDFRGVILINPLYRPGQLSPIIRMVNKRPEWGSRVLRATPLEIIDLTLGWDPTPANRFSPEARLQIAIDYKRASHHIMHIMTGITDLTSRLPEIALPALVIWGDRDRTLKPASFETLVAALPGAIGTPVRGAGHQPHIGQPDLVNQLVIGFLAEIHVDEHHHSS